MGAGRRRVYTVAKTYKLDPAEAIELIKIIAEPDGHTESAVADDFLRRMA